MKIKEFSAELKKLGLKKNDIVLLHSSLHCIKDMENGADGVIDAFMSVLGKNGALIVPVFGKLGIITEVLKKRPGAFISDVPVARLAGIGGRAKEMLENHWEAETAHGEGSPYLKIADAGGYVCLLGVDQDRNTMLHSVEALLRLPYLQTYTVKCQNPEGKDVTRGWKYFPGPHRNFIGLDRYFADFGAMKLGHIGTAEIRLLNARDMLDAALEAGNVDPAFALCDNPACADCVRQRAAIFAATVARNNIALTASSRLCGRYVPEMIENLDAAGISTIELDYVQGKACQFMDKARLKAIAEELAAANKTISALRCFIVPDDARALAGACVGAGIRTVILPLSTEAEALAVLEQAGLKVLLGNECHSSFATARRFAGLKGESELGLAVNPANFVKAGEMPFLQAWPRGRFVKSIGQLDVLDMTWDGTPKRLANGNAEIKELISIVKCHGCSCTMGLGCGGQFPGTLADAVHDFADLLDTLAPAIHWEE